MSSTNVGNIDLGLSVNKQMFNRQLNGIASSAKSSVMSAFKPLGKMIGAALGTAAIAGFTKSCLSLGSNLAEVQNVVDVTFKSMSAGVDSFAKNAMTQFGLSETAAKKYAGTFGAMSKAMGLSESAAYEMSTAVTGLTGDVASFYNLSADEAYTKLKSIWTGETETLKDLGVVMTQTALDNYALNNGFGKTTKQMSEQEKLMLRYQYVMSSLSGAQGDFARTQNSWANQTRVLQLQFESLKATLGQGFINVFTPILKALNLLLGKLQLVANAFKSFTAGLMNKNGIEKAISGGVTEAAALGAGITEAGDNAVSAAQKAKKALAGFDEINTLSFGDSSQSGSAADTGISAGGMDLSGIDEANSAVDSMAEKMGIKLRGGIISIANFFKDKFSKLKNWWNENFAPIFDEIFVKLKKRFSKIVEVFKKIVADIKALLEPLKEWFKGDFTEAMKTALEVIGDILDGILETWTMIIEDIWEPISKVLEAFITKLLPTVTQMWKESFETLGVIFETLKQIFDTVWSEGIIKGLELGADIICDIIDSIYNAWKKWGEPIFENLRTAVKKTGDIILEIWSRVLRPVWENIISSIDKIWTDHLRPLVDNFLDFVGEFVNGALEIYNKFISPVVNWFVNVFGPPISKVINGIIDRVKAIVGNVIDAVNGIITMLKGIVKFVTGVFTGDWDKAWQGIKDIFKGTWDSLVSIVRIPLNSIIGLINGMITAAIEGINCLIRAVNTIRFDIPDWVPGIGGNHFGFDFSEFTAPQIPYLAKGGLAYQPTLAMIGDNKNARTDPEVVAPLSKLQGIIGQNGNAGNDRIYELLLKIYELLRQLELVAQFNVDGRMLEDVIVSLLNKNSFITNGR